LAGRATDACGRPPRRIQRRGRDPRIQNIGATMAMIVNVIGAIMTLTPVSSHLAADRAGCDGGRA